MSQKHDEERTGRGPRRAWTALLLGVALTLALGGLFAAAGGFGDAGTAAKGTAAAAGSAIRGPAAHAAPSPSARPTQRSASSDQYGPDRVTICHRTPGGAQTLVLPTPAADAHLANHRGGHGAGPDTRGPC